MNQHYTMSKAQTTTDNGIEIRESSYEHPDNGTTHVEIPDGNHFLVEYDSQPINYFKLNVHGEGVRTSIRFDEIFRKGKHDLIEEGFNFARNGQTVASINDEDLSDEWITLLKTRYCETDV